MNATERDPVAVALAGVVIGAATGGAIVSLVLVAIHESTRSGGYLDTLFLGGFGGLLAAAGVAWTVARSLANPWRRAMTAMVALGGAAFIGALTIVVDAAAGRWGLIGLTGVCVVLMLLAYRLLAK